MSYPHMEAGAYHYSAPVNVKSFLLLVDRQRWRVCLRTANSRREKVTGALFDITSFTACFKLKVCNRSGL